MATKKVGGQAVIEGIMMRTEKAYSVAVRRPDGSISVKVSPWRSIWEKFPIFKFPFLRGCVILYETLYNGIDSLAFSAKEASGEDENITPNMIFWTIIMSVGISFLLFAVVPHFLTIGLGKLLDSEGLSGGKDVSFHLIDGILKLILFGVFLVLVSYMKDMKRVFQYHGAEHKVVYAYEANDELEVANVKKYSTRHPRCGTSFLLIVIIISIIVFTMVFPFLPKPFNIEIFNQIIFVIIKLFLIFPIAGISYEIIKFGNTTKRFYGFMKIISLPGLMLQHITTKEPDDSQIEVAIRSITEVLQKENEEYV